MLRSQSRFPLLLACVVVLASSLAIAQTSSRVTLDSSETIFTVFAAMNACGYDQGLATSEPVRAQVRSEIASASQASEAARSSVEEVCSFYRDHQHTDPGRNMAQYVSLALNLGDPPSFPFTIKEADLPPDASYVAGLQPRLERFYRSTNLQGIWQRHKKDYDALLERYHGSIAKTLQSTDSYLRLPLTTYSPARFAAFLELLGAPGQVNSRNFGTNYMIVMTPAPGGILPTESIDAVRHTYLHYLLDPMAAQRGRALKRIEPINDYVKTAPMDEAFKEDIGLMMTESLIRAIEIRMKLPGKGKEAEAAREQQIQRADQEGFVLTPYFAQQLAAFEKSEEGLPLAYPNWLLDINVDAIIKHAGRITFASTARTENVQARNTASQLQEAEKRFAAGDFTRAQQLAQKALDQKREDPARALFLLAQVATVSKDMPGAAEYFQRALAVAHEPRLIAWSHIYLGRISDLRGAREEALAHYQAALQAGDPNPKTREAAEQGIRKAYEPPDAAKRRAADKDEDEKTESK